MRFDTPACRGGKAHSTQAGSQRRWPRPDIGQRLIESTGGAASGGPDGRAWAADCPSPGRRRPGRRRPVVGVAMPYALLLGAAACLFLRLMAIYRGWCAPLPPSPQDGDTDAPH